MQRPLAELLDEIAAPSPAPGASARATGNAASSAASADAVSQSAVTAIEPARPEREVVKTAVGD
jgi:hypothetical protein